MSSDPVVERHDSGLQIAVRTLPDSPVASVHLWFDAGAADETDEIAGVAHFVEHMLFKGTTRRKVGEAAGTIEAAGGDLNAWTSWDDTCFHATLECSEVELALDVLFDMTSASLLDEGEIEREKQVVIEEIRGYAEDPDSVAADRLHALLFGRHAYGRPVTGSPNTVAALDRDTVEAFWRSNYHPSRAVLAVAGPIEASDVRRWVDPLVKRWPVGQPRVSKPLAETPQRGAIERLDRDFGSVVVQLGWPGPGIGHPDLPALDVLFTALGQGAGSRLTAELDLARGVASHAWADAAVWACGSALCAGFLCGETEEAIRIAVEEFARTHRNGLSGSLVTRARDAILADLLFATETAEGVANDLAWNIARAHDPLADRRYAEAICAVSPAMVRDVARRWLDPENLRIVALDRALSQKKLSAIVTKARAVPAKLTKGTKGPGGSQEHRINGARVIVLPENSEIAAVQVMGIGGQLAEEITHAGLSEAWARTVTRGAGSLESTAFAERCDTLGAQLEAASSRNTWMVGGSFPASNTPEVLELVGALLSAPHFEPQDWDNVREEMHDDRAALIDSPATIAEEALQRALWPGHPWRLPVLGSKTSVDRISARLLRRHHERLVCADNLVIAVAGGIDPEVVCRTLEPLLEPLPKKTPFVPPTPGELVRTADTSQHAGKDQATVLIGTRGVPIGHADRMALSVATHLLDSQSGRLFLRLREERGLAYGIWARSDTGIGGGTFSAGLSTDPSRVDEAMDALSVELEMLAAHEPSPDELSRVVRMIAGIGAMSYQQVIRRAYDLAWCALFDQPYGIPSLKERLAAITPASVRNALAALDLSAAVRVKVLPGPTKR